MDHGTDDLCQRRLHNQVRKKLGSKQALTLIGDLGRVCKTLAGHEFVSTACRIFWSVWGGFTRCSNPQSRVAELRLTSDSVIFEYHARPGVIRTRLWTERGLLPFIRSTICPKANSSVKCEMGSLRWPDLKRIVTHGGVRLLFFPTALNFRKRWTGHGDKESRTKSEGRLFTHYRRRPSELSSDYNNRRHERPMVA